MSDSPAADPAPLSTFGSQHRPHPEAKTELGTDVDTPVCWTQNDLKDEENLERCGRRMYEGIGTVCFKLVNAFAAVIGHST
jgi:hypothetical protein